jgi:hypothetical protein
MELSLAEIARYLHTGGTRPEGALAERVRALAAEAPLEPRGVYMRDGGRFLLCGTVGRAFDSWQRRLSLSGAADALIAQAIGAAAVEKTMDSLEEEIKTILAPGESLAPRRSPGYGRSELSMNLEILRKLDAARRIGVSATDSFTLVPSKSVTAACEVRSADRF